MENEELRYDRWNSTPWPGWVKPKEAGQPGNRSVRYQEEGTLAMRRIGTPPEVRGQERLTTRSAWTNSGAPQGSGVGSDDKLPEANLWGDMVRWLGCAPIQKDKEEKMSGGKATSIPGSGMGSGKGAQYGKSMERFKTIVISKSRTTGKSLGKGTHMIVPSGGESGEYLQRDTGEGMLHELGNKRDIGQEEQHRKNLVDGFTQVIVSNIEELCFLVAIDLDPELWQIDEPNRMRFMGYIADVIIRVTRFIEEQMEVEVSTDKGAKTREFRIVVYQDVPSLRKQFDEDYRNLGGFLISEDTPIFGLSGTRSSPTLESPTSNVRIKPVGGGTSTFESPQSDTHIGDTQFSSPDRVVVGCQICGSEENGPLAFILTPPHQIKGRTPRSYEACKPCREKECEQNRWERKQVEEEEQLRYEIEHKKSREEEDRMDQLKYIQWEAEMARARESKTRHTSSAPTRRYDEDESGSRDLSDRSQSAQPYERSSRRAERSVAFQEEAEGWRGHTEAQASQFMNEHRNRKLELLKIQAMALKETALHGKKAMETSVQNDTKNQMEWAGQLVKDLRTKAQKHMDTIRSEGSIVPPGSQEVGEAFLEIWKLVYEETKIAATWIRNLYPWLIHIFAQLLSPVTEWIYATAVGKALNKQAWKIEPKRCLQGMMKFWGFRPDGRPHRLTIEVIGVECEKQGVTTVKKQHSLFVLAIQRMGNIQVEQKDIRNYREFTLFKSWSSLSREGQQGEALTILNEFLSHKIDLLKRRYQHAIKAYILRWQPWEEWGLEHLAGYPNFVYYIADKWVTGHPKARGDEVKVESIHSLIQVDDMDERSIGRDDQVIRELIEEIPKDEDWRGHAFRAQTNSFDIYSNQLDEAYSGTFSDLKSLFEWIQKVAMEVQRSVGKASTHNAPVRTPVASTSKSNPRLPERKATVNTLADVAEERVELPDGTEEMGDRSEVEDIEVAGEDEFGDECAEVHMLASLHQQARDGGVRPPSREEEALIDDIMDQLNIKHITLEMMVSKEEWSKIDQENKPYEKIPRTWAAISSIVGKNKQQLDLSGEFKKEFQAAFANLWPTMTRQPEEAVKNHEMKCLNQVANHLNPASHTGMTCVQQLSTCPGLWDFNQRYGTEFTADNLATKCVIEKGCEKNGNESGCAQTGYKNCRAQKTHYFDSAPGMLLELWKVVKKQQQHKSGDRLIPYEERMNRIQLRSFMIGVLMCAFTVHWRKKDRN